MYQISQKLSSLQVPNLFRELSLLPENSMRYGHSVASRAKFLLLSLGLIFLSACSDDFEEVSSGGKVAITLSNESVYLSEVGGQYTVSAKMVDKQGVAYEEQPTFQWQSASSSVATVDQNGLLTAVAFGQTSISVTSGELSSELQVIVSDDAVTLLGTARYEDKEYGASGFVLQQDYYKAIRHAKVSVVDSNGLAVGGIDPVYTDSEGNFQITGILNSQHFIYLSASTDISLGLDLSVRDRDAALYSVSKQFDVGQAGSFTLDIPLSSEASGAFNILDVFTTAAEFTLQYSNLSKVTLSAFWQENNSDGTYFCSGVDSVYCNAGKGVYVYNAINGDTDEYDDDVLFHEFGHYFLQEISRDDSYGGCHALSSTDLDLRLAWSEGWGDFFPSAVKKWMSDDAQRSSLLSTNVANLYSYIDTYQNTQQIYVALDTLNTAYASAANELAVAKVLNSFSLQFGMESIMSVLTGYLPSVTTPVNLESFWDGWLQVNSPTSANKNILLSYLNERGVYYQEDNFEADNAINVSRKISIGNSETHYLYSDQLTTDIDYVAFDVVGGSSYTLSTSNLTGGADTFIRLLDPIGNPLIIGSTAMENDDADESAYYGFDSLCASSRVKNNKTALSSSLTFTAPSTGTYYAELRTTPDVEPYLSAGRYGTFTFSVVLN